MSYRFEGYECDCGAEQGICLDCLERQWGALAAERDALQQRVRALEEALRWIPVEERLPAPEVPVLAFVTEVGSYGQFTRRIRAFYAPAGTVDAGDDPYEAAEYDEEKDTFFLREGWYEKNEYEEINWKVGNPVTHWMPLPDCPRQKALGEVER